MKMFNSYEHEERQGSSMTKSKSLEPLRPVERYFIKEVKKLGIEYDYDVMANELPWFRTLAYTEFAHTFFIQSLSPVIRQRQMLEASQHQDHWHAKDYVKYFVDKVNNNTSNKYNELKDKKIEGRPHLILPVGENKLKETVCLNKLRYIVSSNGPENVYLKPHPLTSHKLVGELRDELGADIVLEHDVDMYSLIKQADVIHTSHRSESILYAAALGKEVDCIDVYQKAHEGSFFSISNLIFGCNNDIDKAKKLINTLFNSYKSGFINPEMDSNWKDTIDQHLEYIMHMREDYRYQYLWNKKGTMEKSKK